MNAQTIQLNLKFVEPTLLEVANVADRYSNNNNTDKGEIKGVST